jgi:hypothetical protein
MSPDTQTSSGTAVGKAALSDSESSARALRLLAIVALLVAIVPVLTYFLTVRFVFGGGHQPGSEALVRIAKCLLLTVCAADDQREFAALTAAVTANVILFSYVAVAMREDKITGREKKD